MANKVRFGLPLVVFLASSLGLAVAQVNGTGEALSRIAGDWRTSPSVEIANSRPALPAASADLGRAPANARLERMLLLLEPSAAQREALNAELASLQDSSSSEYHRFLTPARFADGFANSAGDVEAVSAWLISEGFRVAPLPAGRGWLEFSGTAGQVEEAFRTEVHMASTAQGTRAVLAGAVSVPAALRPAIHGLVSLDGALASAAVTAPQPVRSTAAELAGETSPSRAEALT
ncbi:MAG: protease pro-enzyme activation domain-containing protein, partial [Terracidiphilus sp.]